MTKYCGLCRFLSPKEMKQKPKEKHICKKYNKQVKHLGHHPELPRLPECDEPDKPYDMGEINGVRLTYVNGVVFATPVK